MPGLDGIEFINKALEMGLNDTLYYVLTGGTNAVEEKRIMDAGAQGILIKPLSKDKLKKIFND